MNLIGEIRVGIRRLLGDKPFSFTVLVTLAVCVAANTAIFAIVEAVLLRPLPVPGADRIVMMSNEYPKAGVVNLAFSSAPDLEERKQNVPALAEHAMFQFDGQTIEINQRAERVDSMRVTPSLFRLLQVSPALGRAFTVEEGEIGADDKVILGNGLWRQLYGGDTGAVGSKLQVNGRFLTIVGVMPSGFQFLDPKVQLWLPLAFSAEQKQTRHSNNWHHIGRLAPGATIAQVHAQVKALNAANLDRFPRFREILINAGYETRVEPLVELLVRDVKATLYLLWGAAILVLLIGALNIGNLVVARHALRRQEVAMRMALGAGLGQLVRASIVEHLLLALAGGVCGLALGTALLKWLPAFGLDRLPRGHEIAMSPTVAAVALAMALAVGLVVGLAPLAQVFETRLNEVLREDSRTGTAGRRARNVRTGLVMAQFGLAFLLLAATGLLVQSFRQLLRVEPGFRSDGVVTAVTSAPRVRYADSASLRQLVRRSLAAISALPGVEAAGVTDTLPFSGRYNDSVILAEGYQMKPGESLISPRQLAVSAGYFEAMRIGLVRGRYFDARDDENGQRAVIVDERLAKRFWGDRDPVGLRMYQPSDSEDLLKITNKTQFLTVVGVVRTVRLEDLTGRKSPVGAYYFPMAQSPRRNLGFTVRARGDVASAGAAVRAAIAQVDSELAVFDVKSMEERTRLSLAARRTSLLVATGFAGLALGLSALGIYGVLAYVVAQRTREIGIRAALGCTAPRILGMVLGEGLRTAGLGMAMGMAGVLLLRRVLESQLYDVAPHDAAVLATAGLTLGIVALVGCLIPAGRAARVDPVVALHG